MTLPFRVHPVVAYARAIIQNLPEKTGRSLADWRSVIASTAPEDPRELKQWLRETAGLGATTAQVLVDDQEGSVFLAEDTYLNAAAALIDAQYEGRRAGLRPIAEAVLQAAGTLGPEVGISPTRTLVPIYRSHVIAHIKPASLSRVDLGLALGGFEGGLPDYLLPTGGLEKKDRITHRIALTGLPTREALAWLRTAFDLDA